MEIAREVFDIPVILDPEDIVGAPGKSLLMTFVFCQLCCLAIHFG
jgi:hypothetical protein